MSRNGGCRERVFLVPFDDLLTRVWQKHLKGKIIRAPNPIPKFHLIDLFMRDKSGRCVRMDSDERPVPASTIGDAVGLPHHEKVQMGRRMDNRQTSDEHCQPRLPTEFDEEVDDSPTGDEQRRTARPRISQRSEPVPTHTRNRSVPIRASCDSESVRPQHTT